MFGKPNTALSGYVINKVESAETSAGGTIVTLRGSTKPTFTAYQLENPSRVVVDISHAELGASLPMSESSGKASWTLNTWAAQRVTLNTTGESASGSVRVVIDLARPAVFSVGAQESDIVVNLLAQEARPKTQDNGPELQRLQKETSEAKARAQEASQQIASLQQKIKAEALAGKQNDDRRHEKELALAQARLKSAEAQLAQLIGRNQDLARAAQDAALAKSQAANAMQQKAQAEQQKDVAEQAAKISEQKRLQAEMALASTEDRVSKLNQEIADLKKASGKASNDSEKRRIAAEMAAKEMEQKRAVAEVAAKDAERRKLEAESAALAASEKTKVAEKQVSELAALRKKEEDALKQAMAAKQQIEQARGVATQEKAMAEKERAELLAAIRELEARKNMVEKATQSQLGTEKALLAAQAKASQTTLEQERKRAQEEIGRLKKEREALQTKVVQTQKAFMRQSAEVQRLSQAADRATSEAEDLDEDVERAERAKKGRSSSLEPKAVDFSTELAGYEAVGVTATTVGQAASTGAKSGKKRKVYRQRKIDLDLKDADIHNILRLLADVMGVNIVVPDEIKATVTVRLRDVPADQALEVVLASKALWYRQEGKLIRVAFRKDLDTEDKEQAERLRAMVESEAPEPEIFTLNYANASDIKKQITPLLSPKGRSEIDERTNSVVINDIRAHRRRIIDLMTRLDTQTPQIQIEARIVEARTTFAREVGIQWGGNALGSAQRGNGTGLIFPNNYAVGGGANDQATPSNGTQNVLNQDGTAAAAAENFLVNMPAAVGAGAGGAIGVTLGSLGGNFNLALRLSALEDNGTVRIISSPKVTTSNNLPAEIKSGVQIPVQVVSAQGAQTQFIPAYLQLNVTPAVSQRDCAISMNVEVKKNEPDNANRGARGDPSIVTKEAKTTILVADGQTSVIGGIYTRNTSVAISKVPFFGDIPVLGWLFKKKGNRDERNELLIFITPKITNRAFLRCE